MTKTEKEMTIGELAKKLSRLSKGYREMTLSELVKMALEETTVDALLNKMETCAGDYCQEAVGSLKRNPEYYRLKKNDLKISEKSLQRIVEATLTDFINYTAGWHGGHRDERVEHLAEAFKRTRRQEPKKEKKRKIRKNSSKQKSSQF